MDEDIRAGACAADDAQGAKVLDSGAQQVEERGRTRRRRRRKQRPRGRTISIRRLSKAELERGARMYPERDYWKPRTRKDCADVPRPCPYVSCKYHLYLDVHPIRGSIKLNFRDIEVWEMAESCALDVAERGAITLEDVGELMNLTRERVRQLEASALAKLKLADDLEVLRDFYVDGELPEE